MHPIDFVPSSALFRLMDLPNELIKLVCSHADLSIYDLMALRRTCKLTREFSSDKFAERCFFSITVLMARSSLRAFIELSQHPRFGPFVKWIAISPTFASAEGLRVLPSATGPLAHEAHPVLEGARLTAFIKQHSATLHDLQLHEVCLITGSCMSLIAWIKDNLPCLKYLEIDEMCEHGSKTICDDDALKSYWAGYGKEKDVQVSLANMLDGNYDHKTVVEEYNAFMGIITKDE
ncbi:hypothetical protein D6D00_06571 [Aureobasidium pullulans]|nr:hypothetical protein D6D00_06571 [Aureobasidium pullulans]